MTRHPPVVALAVLALGVSYAGGSVPATAAPRDRVVPYTATVEASPIFGEDSADCEVVDSSDHSDSASLPTSGTNRTVSAAAASTIANTVDTADHTTVSGAAKATAGVRYAGGVPQRFRFSGSASSSLDAARDGGSVCEGTSAAFASLTTQVTLTKPLWLTSDLAGKGSGTITVYLMDTAGVFSVVGYGGVTSTHHRKVLLPAGDVSFIAGAQASSDVADDDGPPVKQRVSGTVTGVFTRPGVALGKARGAARAAVRFAAQESCTAHSVKLTWKRKVAAADKLQVLVNGKVRKTVKDPKPGRALVVKQLKRAGVVVVGVRLLGTNGSATTVTRTYEACA